jgi:tetratricopeptide (TPR) repeat protein
MRSTTACALALCLIVAAPAFAQMGIGGNGRIGHIPNQTSTNVSDEETAVRLIRDEKFADAIPYLERALEQHPRDANIMMLLGLSNGSVGNLPQSLDWYQNALARDPDHKLAHENLGILYLKMNDLASAKSQLAELVRLCPDGCDERDGLEQALAWYMPSPPATPAPAPAAGAPH